MHRPLSPQRRVDPDMMVGDDADVIPFDAGVFFW